MHNHPVWQSNFRDIEELGWDATLEWWEAGNEATDGPLYTNEMGNVAGDFFRDQHFDFVERLLDDGAPVDGVGFMGHVQLPNGNVTPPKEMLETYDQYAELDLPVLITEFDIQIDSRDDEAQVEWQVDFLRDFLYASFSHEAVEGSCPGGSGLATTGAPRARITTRTGPCDRTVSSTWISSSTSGGPTSVAKPTVTGATRRGDSREATKSPLKKELSLARRPSTSTTKPRQ